MTGPHPLAPPRPVTAVDIASWCLAAVALLGLVTLHLLPALISGLLVFELAQVLGPPLQRRFSPERSGTVVVILIVFIIAGLLAALVLGAQAFLRHGANSLPVLLQKLAEILDSTRLALPAWISQWIPADVDAIRRALSGWLREHAQEVRVVSAEALRAVVQIAIGMAIAAIVSFRHVVDRPSKRPLAAALRARSVNFGEAFRQIVFAQVRISAVNTALTAVYLAVVLPLLGVHLPFTKTMIFVTFVAGLLPVVGNLISNTVILLVSLANSAYVAAGSLAWLVAIHKLEYFLNARIVGGRIQARPWELLIAMLVMESAFGVGGLVAAPIYYAYLKRELSQRGLI